LKKKISIKPYFLIFLFVSIATLFFCDGLIEDWEVNYLTEDFVHWYAQTFPFETSKLGNLEHKRGLFNPDLKNIEKINEQLKKFSWRLFLVDTSTISFENRVNFHILRSKINYLLFEFQQWKRWQYDTYFYSQKLFKTFNSFPPLPADSLENNFHTIYDKIKTIPVFLKNARKNLIHINKKNIDTAIEQIESIKNELFNQFSMIQTSDSVMLDSLNYFSEVALDSLLNFQQFLADEKLKTQHSLPQLDKNLYQTLVKILLGNDLHLDSLVKIVEKDYLTCTEKMATIALDYLNEQNRFLGNVSKERLCEIMIAEINTDIPRKDQILSLCTNLNNYHKLYLDEIVDFSLPTNYSMNINWASTTNNYPNKLIELFPGYQSGDSCFFKLKIKPIPDDIEWIEQLSVLRDYNKTNLKTAMLLDGFPIHYNFWLNKKQELPLAAKFFPEQSYLTGFTFNFVSTLVASGLGGYDKLLEFKIMENFASICFGTLVELKYYMFQYSDSKVDSLLKTNKLFTRSQSRHLLKDINCNPGQNLLTYWGIRKFRNVEKKCADFQGRKFRKKEFYKLVLRQGPIPLILLEEKLLP
jgi:hypothetical protein